MTSIASADIQKIAEAQRRTGANAQATTMGVLIESANTLLVEMEVRVPVDSGKLRDSLRVQVEGDKVYIGSDLPYATYVEFGTAPHEIKPKDPDGVLRFVANGQVVYAKVVQHPGTKPQPFVRPAFDAWKRSLGKGVAQENVNYFVREAERG